jgi:hypothetical protein
VKYSVFTAQSGMVYIPSFMKNGSRNEVTGYYLEFLRGHSVGVTNGNDLLTSDVITPKNTKYLDRLREPSNSECLKKSFTTLEAYVHLFREHVQCFELS